MQNVHAKNSVECWTDHFEVPWKTEYGIELWQKMLLWLLCTLHGYTMLVPPFAYCTMRRWMSRISHSFQSEDCTKNQEREPVLYTAIGIKTVYIPVVICLFFFFLVFIFSFVWCISFWIALCFHGGRLLVMPCTFGHFLEIFKEHGKTMKDFMALSFLVKQITARKQTIICLIVITEI